MRHMSIELVKEMPRVHLPECFLSKSCVQDHAREEKLNNGESTRGEWKNLLQHKKPCWREIARDRGERQSLLQQEKSD